MNDIDSQQVWMIGDTKFCATIIAVVFIGAGCYMLPMPSGNEGIPDDVYEAAMPDGAGPLQKSSAFLFRKDSLWRHGQWNQRLICAKRTVIVIE